MPFLVNVWKLRFVAVVVLVVVVKGGIVWDGVKLDGAKAEFVILWNFHQAVRAEATVFAFKCG